MAFEHNDVGIIRSVFKFEVKYCLILVKYGILKRKVLKIYPLMNSFLVSYQKESLTCVSVNAPGKVSSGFLFTTTVYASSVNSVIDYPTTQLITVERRSFC